jgi:PHP family Zn ribbon phosphoesterase
VADFIKCVCSNCGAKYRLPVEFQGRRARCKKCGEKFEVPKKKKTLEDSVLDWLAEGEEEEKEEAVAQPRVINIPKENSDDSDGETKSRKQGPIRMKSTPASTDD